MSATSLQLHNTAQQIVHMLNEGCGLMRAIGLTMPQPMDVHQEVLHLVMQHYACWATPAQSERLVAEVMGGIWEDMRSPLLTKALVIHLGAHGADPDKVLLWLRAAIHADHEQHLPQSAFLAVRAWASRAKNASTVLAVVNSCMADNDPVLHEIATALVVGASRDSSGTLLQQLHRHHEQHTQKWWTKAQWEAQGKDILARLCDDTTTQQRLSKKLWRAVISTMPMDHREELLTRLWTAVIDGKMTAWNKTENNHIRHTAHTHLTPKILSNLITHLNRKISVLFPTGSGFLFMARRFHPWEVANNIAHAVVHRLRLDQATPATALFQGYDLEHAHQELRAWGDVVFDADKKSTSAAPLIASAKQHWQEMLACLDQTLLMRAAPNSTSTRNNTRKI